MILYCLFVIGVGRWCIARWPLLIYTLLTRSSAEYLGLHDVWDYNIIQHLTIMREVRRGRMRQQRRVETKKRDNQIEVSFLASSSSFFPNLTYCYFVTPMHLGRR